MAKLIHEIWREDDGMCIGLKFHAYERSRKVSLRKPMVFRAATCAQTDTLSKVKNYLSCISSWNSKGPLKVADRFAATAEAGESDDWFHAYTWYLIALELGDDEAADAIDTLETAELICDEDRFLANLQISIWFYRGIVLPKNSIAALARLPDAAFPFLVLPSMEDISNAPDVSSFRDAAWKKALIDFGFPPEPLKDNAAANRCANTLITQIIELTGWGAIDYSAPLGPSVPNRPFWIHHRHELNKS
jgi:hypothetical protein